MAKDSKQADIKAGDRVTITGTVVDASHGDTSPCQVRLDGGSQPLVSIGSELLTVSVAQPAAETKSAATAATNPHPPPDKPAAPAAPAAQTTK